MRLTGKSGLITGRASEFGAAIVVSCIAEDPVNMLLKFIAVELTPDNIYVNCVALVMGTTGL
jgi:hypothetical protein